LDYRLSVENEAMDLFSNLSGTRRRRRLGPEPLTTDAEIWVLFFQFTTPSSCNVLGSAFLLSPGV